MQSKSTHFAPHCCDALSDATGVEVMIISVSKILVLVFMMNGVYSRIKSAACFGGEAGKRFE